MKKSPVKKSAAPSAAKKAGVASAKASSAKKPAVKTVKKAAAPAKKAVAVKKAAAPAKKAVAVKKAAAPAKKAVAVKKAAAPAKKAVAVKKAAAPAKKAVAVKKTAAPAKKSVAVKKAVAPVAKKAVAVKKAVAPVVKKAAAPVKKAAPVEKVQQHKKLKLTKAQKKHYRDLLIKARNEFASRLRSHQEDALSGKRDSAGERAGMATHMADLGSDNFRHDLDLSLMTDEGDVLEMIDEALQKIEDSEYGICVDCECAINPERLEAKPYAWYCIRCKDRHEKMEDPQRRHR